MVRFIHEVHMRWSDMDAFRHINNSAYLAYLEQARVAMFFDRDDGRFSSGTVIARHEIDYLFPVVYHPQPLQLELWIERVRGAEFTVRYEVFDDSRLVARAATRCVTFDFEMNRPRRLTGEEQGILRSFADEISSVSDAGPSDAGLSGAGAATAAVGRHDGADH
jgi:acyl-CoA thioester hydrolase